VRVELATVDTVGRYTHEEHKVCFEVVLNRGRVNRVFEHGGVPYGKCLEPGSEACEAAARKRKQDAGTRPSVKRVKVSGQKMAPAKMPTLSKTVKAAFSKTTVGWLLILKWHQKLQLCKGPPFYRRLWRPQWPPCPMSQR
jgi:hypothetical protein